MRNRWWAAPVLAGAAALIAACGSSAAPSTSASTPTTGGTSPATSQQSNSSSSSSTVTIMTQNTSKGTVLANAQGQTIYWFAIDTPTKSNCNGSCASFWPPVIGKAAAASGMTLPLPHGFGTITRADGDVQATYFGHPLYTYMGDTAAGQINGNGKNLSGGLWWAMTPTSAKIGAPATSSSSSSSAGGGYGY
jgi:predicted lipoprotein with Yx(FWY)xxD motif